MEHLAANTKFFHFIHPKYSCLLPLKTPKIKVHNFGAGARERFNYIGIILSFNSLSEVPFQKWMHSRNGQFH